MSSLKGYVRLLCVLAFACVLSLGAVHVALAQSPTGQSPAGPAANPVINVGHFAPFATTADDTSVTVRVSGTDAITEFVYPDVVKGIDILPAGTYTVEILPTGTATVAISGVVTLESDKQYTLLAIGDGVNQPLALKALDDNPAAPAPGTARVRIAHYAPFANTLAATRVDICVDATDTAVPGLTNVEFGVDSGWLPLPAGIYDLFVSPSGTNCSSVALELPALAILAGKTYDVYAVGGANGWPLDVKSITGLDFPAHVTVGHFAPFSTTVGGTSVDIKVNGALAFTSVVFGDFVPQVQLPPGPTLVEILPAGTSTVALSGTVNLAGASAYDLFAIGGANGWPLAFSATEISKTAPLGKALITIGHLAPFAPTSSATAVDICTDANAVVLGGVEYPNVAANVALEPGVYDLKIALAGTGCAVVALDLPPIVLAAGEIYDVFAIGTLTNAFPLEVTTTTGLELASLVTVGHFAPFAADVAGTAVDIRVNGSLAFTNVVFGDFVPKVALPPGPTLVEILPAGTATVALSGTFTLTAGTNYDLFAIGGANSQDLAFSATVISDTAPAGKALVTIGHLAPFATDVDATAVDICTDDGAPVPGLTNLKYPQVLANLALDPGPYDLQITIAGSNCESLAIDLPRFRLFAGDIADVFAIGTITDEFPLEIVTTTGLYTVERFLPIIRVFAQGF